MRALVLLAIVLAGASSTRADAPSAAADLIIHGGRTLTMDGARPTYAEAVVVDDGKIAFVGTKDDALARKGPGTVIRDLEGKTMLPAFVDAHSHFINAPALTKLVNVGNPPVGPATD